MRLEREKDGFGVDKRRGTRGGRKRKGRNRGYSVKRSGSTKVFSVPQSRLSTVDRGEK